MKRKLTLELIQKLQKEIRKKIIDLNSGGCGHFAYIFALHCEKYQIPYHIEIYDTCKISIYSRKRNIKLAQSGDHEPRILSAGHIMIKSNNIRFDGYYIEDTYNCEYNGRYKLRELEIALLGGSWNSTYHTGQNIKLEQIISKFFKKYF